MSLLQLLFQLCKGYVRLPGDGDPQILLDLCRQQTRRPMPRLELPLAFSGLELLAADLLRISVTDAEQAGQLFQASTSTGISVQKLRAHVVGIGLGHMRSSRNLATLNLKQNSPTGYNY